MNFEQRMKHAYLLYYLLGVVAREKARNSFYATAAVFTKDDKILNSLIDNLQAQGYSAYYLNPCYEPFYKITITWEEN